MKTKNDTLNAIQTMVDSAMSRAGYDKTRNAVVIARNTNNTYKIKMDGIEYDNVVFYGSGEAQVNEVVKVVIPNNQASQMYVMGKGGFELPRHIEVDELVTHELTIALNDCTITDSGTALSVTAGADTDDGQLAQAVIDAFDYATAKEILEGDYVS